MPDFDTGHIFLTTMAPIRRPETDKDIPSEANDFYLRIIRAKLAGMHPARQSPATLKVSDVQDTNGDYFNSPFARNYRTHLARMFVLEDVVYNGRPGGSAISSAVGSQDTLIPLKEDHLNCAYLVFCADIDAVLEDGDELPYKLPEAQQQAVRRAYFKRLWETMGDDLRAIYENCHGFKGAVRTADDFADYLDKCHVETTMPFHDYFCTERDEKTTATLPEFPLKPYVYLGLLLLAVALVSMIGIFWKSLALFSFIGSIVLLAVLALIGAKHIHRGGLNPWPHSEYDDLSSVLKALYIQQKFSQFVVDNQSTSPANLHTNFGEFYKEHNPEDKRYPSQAPGVISSSIPGGTVTKG